MSLFLVCARVEVLQSVPGPARGGAGGAGGGHDEPGGGEHRDAGPGL